MTRSFLMALLVVLLPGAALAKKFEHAPLGLSFEVPDDFQTGQASGSNLFQFVKQFGDGSRVSVLIQKMGSTIEPGPMKIGPKMLPPGAKSSREDNLLWKSHPLEVHRLDMPNADTRLITFGTQVPLKPEAIQVMVSCDLDHQEEAQAALRSIATSVEGESSWGSDDGQATMAASLVAVFVGVGVAFFLLLRGKQKQRSGAGST